MKVLCVCGTQHILLDVDDAVENGEICVIS